MLPSLLLIRSDDDVISLAASFGGLPIDIISAGSNVSLFRWADGLVGPEDAIDDQNASHAALVESSGSHFCAGIEVSAGDEKPWKDVTAGGCDRVSKDCVYQDKISGLQWLEATDGNGTNYVAPWGYTMDYCENLSFAGQSDWRMPTQKEITQAYVHNMRSVNNSFWVESLTGAPLFWSASASSETPAASSWGVSGSSGLSSLTSRNRPLSMICVRRP